VTVETWDLVIARVDLVAKGHGLLREFRSAGDADEKHPCEDGNKCCLPQDPEASHNRGAIRDIAHFPPPARVLI